MESVRLASGAFIWRRIHSLMGLWLVLFLTNHLLVNSQAALWIGDDGHGFVRMVNLLESLPFLEVIELVLIGVPLAVHAVWGVKRIFAAKTNSLPYGRNRAFNLQMLTSWILLVGVVLHVFQMRFWEYPKEAEGHAIVDVSFDEGLVSLSERLGVSLYSLEEIHQLPPSELATVLRSYDLKPDRRAAVAPSEGTAMLLTMRDTFKSPLLSLCYTIFVLAAAFHACNGLWTSLITWGMILSYRSQRSLVRVTAIWGVLLAFLGLAAIWGSYWINLRH